MSTQESIITLKPVFHLSFDLEEIQPVASRAAGDDVVVNITGGFTKSYDEKYPFNSTILHGRDDILVNPTHNSLDCRVYGKTEDGAGFTIRYGGIVQASAPVGAVCSGQSNGHTYEESYVTNNMTVFIDKDAPKKYDWIKFHNLVGRGRFFRDDKGFHIEYIMHAIVQ
ncbi:uncharacterized protein SAPINGB_P000476 [Magnusiomyces paraingens]|uniref:Uncharacterized protein n=1 Tax=Magnusiomyces paraingens TaxID=2606893 RepID=A0A5E8B091_9ASCO|nr:uncharacterized protein SAPINGB_P000476 [Saprochaete ingens]VVT44618.1 unnamed protein product [Saprochaete ingens]